MFGFKIIFWYWWALAAVLLVFEMMLPGVVFLFLAMGGAAAGLFLLVAPDLSLEMQLAVFAVIAVVSAVALRPLLHRLQTRTGESNLNARGDSLIGKTIVLDAPILAGRGRAIGGGVPDGDVGAVGAGQGDGEDHRAGSDRRLVDTGAVDRQRSPCRPGGDGTHHLGDQKSQEHGGRTHPATSGGAAPACSHARSVSSCYLCGYREDIPTTGLLSLMAPVEPRKAASPKEKMPPSVATMR